MKKSMAILTCMTILFVMSSVVSTVCATEALAASTTEKAYGGTIKARHEPPAVRTGDVSMSDARKNAKEPAWAALLNPFIGVIGVGVGARVRQQKEPLPDES